MGYYVPAQSATRAVAEHGSFNVVHPGGPKVDLFVLGDGLLDELQLQRRVRAPITADPQIEVWVTSPADQVLRKLNWYRPGGRSSDRQWRDVCGLLEAQWRRLDVAALKRTADEVGLGDLLAEALEAVGIDR